MVVRHQGRSIREVSSPRRSGITNQTGDAACPPAAALVVHTPAKLNLALKVLGRRADGYHELETVMVSIGLFDTLRFVENDSGAVRLTCHHAASLGRSHNRTTGGGELSSGADNLVVKAAERLRQRTGCQRGVSIELVKRIPMQAGLGGGSSDAAATLVALNRLWEFNLTSAALHELAAELGSDVNFFLDSPIAAVCRGRGEHVESIRLPQRLHAVLVCPPTGLSTAAVFQQWSRMATSGDDAAGVSTLSAMEVFNALLTGGRAGRLANDLEQPARRLNPDVDVTLRQLKRWSLGPVGMTGSGTGCFALCPTAMHARRLAARLRGVLHGHVLAVDSRA